MRFGRLIGAGQCGYVFQNMDQPEHYLKIVALPNKPLSEYPHKSWDAALYAANQNQSQLMKQLFESGNMPASLPKIYSYTEGKITPLIQRQLMESDEFFPWDDSDDFWTMLREFRIGQRYAIWEIETIPCLSESDFCNRFETDSNPLQNKDYQELLRYLLKQGFVVRDIRNPENYGFRQDGSQVFFDPVIAPWPVSESDKNKNPDRYWAFRNTFGDEISMVKQTIEDGRYFTWYHGQAVMQSETEESESSESSEPIAMPDATPEQWAELFQKWDSDNEDAEFRVWMPTRESEGIIEMLRWQPSLVSFPEQTMSLNWWSLTSQYEASKEQIKFATDLINYNWKWFSENFNEHFQDIFYPHPRRPRNNSLFETKNRKEPLWDFIQDFDYTTQSQIVFPTTTLFWNLQYHPDVRKEVDDGDIGTDHFIEVIYDEHFGMKQLIEMCRGSPIIVSNAISKAIRSMSRKNYKGDWYFEPRYSIEYWEEFYEEYPDSDSRSYAYENDIKPDKMSWKINPSWFMV